MNQIKKENKTEYPLLFRPLKVGKHIIGNRVVSLPVHSGFAYRDGRPSSWMMDFYARLANSGAGMVIVANTAVSPDGQVSGFNLRADKDEFIQGLSKIADAIKKNGSIACLQLNHAGRFARTKQPLLPSPITSSNLSFNVESLKGFMEFFPFEKRFSLTRYFINQIKSWRRSMTSQDRERVINDFAGAAFRAYQAGFDMVELHGANGYLLCQYLSAFTNKIPSDFGGDFTGRTRFPLEIIRKMKKKLPKDFPIGFRLLLQEWVPQGIDLPEALAFAKILEKEGIAYLSVSAGTYNSLFSPDVLKNMARPAYLRHETAKLTSQVNIPTIISGRITTPSLAEKLLQDGTADLIGLGRPLRADPRWVAKAKAPGQKIIQCRNCNQCLKQVVLEKGFNCRQWPKLFQKRTELEHKLLTRNYRTLWIIADINDIQTFKHSLPLLVQKKKDGYYPTILFLQDIVEDQNFDSARQNFIQWTENMCERLGFKDSPRHYTIREPRENWEKAVHLEINQGNHGQIFICSNPSQPWRERLLYKERARVLVHLNTHSHPHRIMVPVDLSDATLLVMMFLKQTHMDNKKFSFNFVHVVTGPSGQEELRWKELKKIVGLDKNIPIELIFTKKEVVSALIKIIQTREYGTIVMGKRGLSGIKQWLLGSVSAGVLHKLKGQSLFLID